MAGFQNYCSIFGTPQHVWCSSNIRVTAHHELRHTPVLVRACAHQFSGARHWAFKGRSKASSSFITALVHSFTTALVHCSSGHCRYHKSKTSHQNRKTCIMAHFCERCTRLRQFSCCCMMWQHALGQVSGLDNATIHEGPSVQEGILHCLWSCRRVSARTGLSRPSGA